MIPPTKLKYGILIMLVLASSIFLMFGAGDSITSYFTANSAGFNQAEKDNSVLEKTAAITGDNEIINISPEKKTPADDSANKEETLSIKENTQPENSDDSKKSKVVKAHGRYTPESFTEEAQAEFAPEQKINLEVMNQIEENPEAKIPIIIKADKELKKTLEEKGIKITVESDDYIAIEADGDTIKELAAENIVEKIYSDRVYQPMLAESVPNIKANFAWDLGYKGAGMKVAVIDSGIDTNHPMFTGRILASADFSASPSNYKDIDGHGTHVAGIIAGNGTYKGVAPEALLLNAKVISDTTHEAKTSSIIAAIEWATTQGAKVISMSLGGAYSNPDDPMNAAIAAAVSKGAVVVVSAGNCGGGCPSSACGSFRGITTPGNSPYAITVGAVDDSNNIACFSSTGEAIKDNIKPDIVAPGVNIISSAIGGGYVSKQGTSMAAPHISGAIALMLQKNPGLAPGDVKKALNMISDDLGKAGKDTVYGSGIVNVQKMMNFDPSQLVEYDVHYSESLLYNSPQEITVDMVDNLVPLQVTGIITSPKGTKIPIVMQKAGDNSFSYTFTNTSLNGVYEIYLNLAFENFNNEYNGKFNIVKPSSGLGAIESITVPSQIIYGQDLGLNVTFRNLGESAADTFIEAALIDSEGNTAATAASATKTVQAQSAGTFEVHKNLEVMPKNYTLRISAIFDGESVTNQTLIRILDNKAPQLEGVSFKDIIKAYNPAVAKFMIKDDSELSGEARFILPNQEQRIIKLKKEALNNSIAATLEDTQLQGAYKFSARICDNDNNCINTTEYTFTVEDCSKIKLLVVKNDDKKLFENSLAANFCVSSWDRRESFVPSLSYMNKFSAVLWDTGNSLKSLDNESILVLTQYIQQGGRLFISGADFAYNQRSDPILLESLADSELEKDMLLLSSGEQNKNIMITREHFITKDLGTSIGFNLSVCPYPDSVIVKNRGTELAKWDNGGSAIVIVNKLNETGSKTLFIPFAIEALDQPKAASIIQRGAVWLLMGNDLPDVSVDNVNMPYLIEGSNTVQATIKNIGTKDFSGGKITFVIDNSTLSTQIITSLSPQQTAIVSLAGTLTPGNHTLKIIANSEFETAESNYINNVFSKKVRVATKKADLTVLRINYTESNGQVLLKSIISNIGGTNIPSTSVKISINNNPVDTKTVGVNYGEEKVIESQITLQKGVYTAKAEIDYNSAIDESDEANNRLEEPVYLCSKEKILIVDDNDGENYAGENPSSAKYFDTVLKQNQYCTQVWDEASQGVPSIGLLNSFDIVVWTSGNYWNYAIDDADKQLLRGYYGKILYEGADIGFDNDEDFLINNLHAELERDYALLNVSTIDIDLSQHQIGQIGEGISKITLNASLCHYPDALIPIDSDSVAAWNEDNSSAVIAYAGDFSKFVYMGFSIKAVENADAKDTLVSNSIDWLLSKSGCKPNWTCSAWSVCKFGMQNRTCFDAKNCSVLDNKPEEIRSCVECLNNSQCAGNDTCFNGRCVEGLGIATLSDGSLQKELVYTSAGEQTVYIDVPKNVQITEAKFDVTGLNFGLPDGSSCSSSSECSSDYCVHGKCRSTSTYCGDGYIDSGENCGNCAADAACSSGKVCNISQCVAVTCSTNANCGTNGYIGNKFCTSNDVYQAYRTYTCNNPGTINAQCTQSDVNTLVTDCTANQVCTGSACANVACFANSGCGTNGYVGSQFCSANDVYQAYRTYTCNNPGTASASCTQSDVNTMVTDCTANQVCTGSACANVACFNDATCGTDAYIGSKFCTSGDVYQVYRRYRCSFPGTANARCDQTDQNTLITDCTANQVCTGSACANVACSSNSQCGTNGYVGSQFCSANDVYQAYRTYTCNNPGTASASCTQSDVNTMVTDCAANQLCSGNTCVNIACSSNANCGTNGYVGSRFCSPSDGENTDAYQAYRTYTCSNPGTLSSSCSYSDSNTQVEDCGDTQTTWYGTYTCITDLYENGAQTIRACSAGTCSGHGKTVTRLVQDCTANQVCSGNACVNVACFSNSQCGTNGYIGSTFCTNNDVYKVYRTYTCNNPGTASASCTQSDVNTLVTDCTANQVCTGSACANVACSSNSQCGTNGYVGSRFCSPSDGENKDAYQAYRTYTCSNPGTVSASCSYSDSNTRVEDCGDSQTVWSGTYYCGTDLYERGTQYTMSCSSGTCGSFGISTNRMVQDCTANQVCSGNACANVACFSNSQCGTSGYVSSAFCTNNDVYKIYRTYTCSNPGTASASCSQSDVNTMIADCTASQTCDSASGTCKLVGIGTAITTCQGLSNIRNCPSCDYHLEADVNCGVSPFNSGTGFAPLGIFTGRLDGMGYKISGLYIPGTGQNSIGMFTEINSGYVKNLQLVNVNVVGSQNVGGLAGRLKDGGLVENVNVSGSVRGDTTTGGLIGYMGSTTANTGVGGYVRYCSSSATVYGAYYDNGGLVGRMNDNSYVQYSSSKGSVQSGSTTTGGLVGYCAHSFIQNSYSSATVTTPNFGGGLLGMSDQTANVGCAIDKSYATGTLNIPGTKGGLCGYKASGGATSSYFDYQTTGATTDPCGAVSKTTAQMKTQSTFSGWDFTSVWTINGGYPYLRPYLGSAGSGGPGGA